MKKHSSQEEGPAQGGGRGIPHPPAPSPTPERGIHGMESVVLKPLSARRGVGG